MILMILDCGISFVIGISSVFIISMWPFISLERDGRCATTSMSAGQTSGYPKVLQPCWTSVSMYFKGGRLQSRVWVPVGQGLQGAPLWLCTAVPVSAAQVNTRIILGFKCTFIMHLVATLLDIQYLCIYTFFWVMWFLSWHTMKAGYHLIYFNTRYQ